MVHMLTAKETIVGEAQSPPRGLPDRNATELWQAQEYNRAMKVERVPRVE